MAAAVNFVKELLLSLMILLSMFFAPFSAEKYEAENPEEVKLVFNAVSDVHVETNYSASYSNFEKVIRGMKANNSSDVNVFLGDNTMNGQEIESFLFFAGVNAMLDCKNVFITLGNHDIGNGEGEYNELIDRYISYNNTFLKNDIEKPYYYRVIDGCYMIFLASEKLCVHSFYMSDEQIEWFANVLEEASKTENPVFIFSHHPLNYIEHENRNILFDMCENYRNIYSLHGHTHWAYNVYENRGITCVNLPRVTETVDYAPGIGVTVEVYENEVILRQRDFYENKWLDEVAFEIIK